jgi:hypothetical protein
MRGPLGIAPGTDFILEFTFLSKIPLRARAGGGITRRRSENGRTIVQLISNVNEKRNRILATQCGPRA